MKIKSTVTEVRIHEGNPWSTKGEDVLVVSLENDGDKDTIVLSQEDVDGGHPRIYLTLERASVLREVLGAIVASHQGALPPVVSQEVLK